MTEVAVSRLSVGRICLCIALLSASLVSAAEPRRVVLTARISVANDGDKPVAPFDEKGVQARAAEDAGGRRYLSAADGIEADAPTLRAVAAGLTAGGAGRREQARAAYDYVRRTLKLRDMTENRGALYALEHGGGDCTEFNSLFVALAPGADKALKVDVAWSLRDLAAGGR